MTSTVKLSKDYLYGISIDVITDSDEEYLKVTTLKNIFNIITSLAINCTIWVVRKLDGVESESKFTLYPIDVPVRVIKDPVDMLPISKLDVLDTLTLTKDLMSQLLEAGAVPSIALLCEAVDNDWADIYELALHRFDRDYMVRYEVDSLKSYLVGLNKLEMLRQACSEFRLLPNEAAMYKAIELGNLDAFKILAQSDSSMNLLNGNNIDQFLWMAFRSRSYATITGLVKMYNTPYIVYETMKLAEKTGQRDVLDYIMYNYNIPISSKYTCMERTRVRLHRIIKDIRDKLGY